MGLVDGALSFLLRREGVDPARGASIVALVTLPHAIYFLWGPVSDFWLSRRNWLMLAAVAAAVAELAAFHQARLGSPLAVGLLFLSMCFGGLVVAACGGIMGELRSQRSRRQAGSFYQSGSLAFGGAAVFLLVSLAGRLSLAGLGWIVAAMIVLPALFAFAAPRQPEIAVHSVHESAARIWREFRSTFLRWEAIPYTLLITFPMCSGAMLGLLPGLAADYGVSGAQVAWIDREEDGVQAAVRDCIAPQRSLAIACDVADESAAEAAVQRTVAHFGGLHVLVNNAAMAAPLRPIGEVPVTEWRRMLDVNVTGAFIMARAAIAHLKRSAGAAVILNIASQLGHVTNPGSGAYSTSKAALLGLTRSIAVDYASQGIRAVSLSPCSVMTSRLTRRYGSEAAVNERLVPRHPIGRIGRPEEIAEAALFLVSDGAAFITGTDLLADGGYTAV